MDSFGLIYSLTWTLTLLPILPFIPIIGDSHLKSRIIGPAIDRNGDDTNIWVHALSLGEVLSSIPLLRALRNMYPDKKIILSVTTRQGFKIASKTLNSEISEVCIMPIDFWWSIKRIISHINPCIFILVETDIWPGLIHMLKSRGVPTVLVNGRISPRTFRMYRRFKPLISHLLNMIDVCLMQSDLDTHRMISSGVDTYRVFTVGNIKFDQNIAPMREPEREQWFNVLGLKRGTPIWIVGSTHLGEEEIILDVFKKLRDRFSSLKLVIAPRDISRAENILSLIRGHTLKGALRSRLREDRALYDVLVLDTLGELNRIYGIATVAFVGGSLVPVGGHNLLEPATFGVPVLFGPHTHNFVSMSENLLRTGGGIRVVNGDELFKILEELIQNPEKREAMGACAMDFVKANRGAISRVMEHIKKRIPLHDQD